MDNLAVIDTTTGEVMISPEVREEAIKLLGAKAAAAIAKRNEDFESLERAELSILDSQRTIAQEYEKEFRGTQGKATRPERFNADEWCKAAGTSRTSVSRWREELLDAEKFSRKREAITKKVRQLVELFLSANTSSNSEEWYTPKKYLDAVHQVFMPDLDPASNDFANQTVKAKEFWTREQSEAGPHTLDRDWHGRVFCNPPYGKDPEYGSLAGAFCNKAIAEYEMGNVSECILLVNSLHSQNWQAPLYDYVICLVDHRIQFVSGDGTENKSPTMQNLLIYLGDNKELFKEAFTPFGYVMEKV